MTELRFDRLTVGGEGGRLDLGKIRFWVCSPELSVRLYDIEGGSGGDRGLLRISGDRCSRKKQQYITF